MRRYLVTAGILLSSLLLSTGALAQEPTLTINGVTGTDNGAIVDAPPGGLLVIDIDDPGNAGGAYALVAGVAPNARTQGWWIEIGFLLKKDGSGVSTIYPVPLVTGIPTDDIESDFTFFDGSPLDLRPDRPGSPFIYLDGSGHVERRFIIPFNDNLSGIVFQAVSLRSNGELHLTNGVGVNISSIPVSAALAAAHGGTSTGMELGALDFQDDPANALFTPDAGFSADVIFLPIALSGIQWLVAGENITEAAGSQIDCHSYKSPAKSIENDKFQYIAIPPAPGADGQIGTADDIPARRLYRIKVLESSTLWGYLVVNMGPNPNTPGQRYFVPEGSLLADSSNPDSDYWQDEVLVSQDFVHIFAATDPPGSSPDPQDGAKIIAIDGTTPYAGQAILDVTPEPSTPFAEIAVDASVLGRDMVIIAASENWGSTTKENFYYWANVDGTGGPTNIPIPVVTNTQNPVKSIDEDSLVWNDAVTTMAFVGGSSRDTEDEYSIVLDAPGGPVCINISRFDGKTKIRDAGDTYDGRDGWSAVSPDGKSVAYTAIINNDDWLYLAQADGSDAGSNRLVTDSSTFRYSSQDDVRDVWFPTDDLLLFWFGAAGGSSKMDLYRFNMITLETANITGTSGDLEPDYESPGNIYNRGQFLSGNGRYLFFLRDGTTDPQGRDAANLVGIDLQTWVLFDMTGSEFSDGFAPDSNGPDSNPSADKWQFFRAPGDSDVMWFVSRYASSEFGGTDDQQMWFMDGRFPFAAYPMTHFDNALGRVLVDSPIPAGFGPIVSYAAGVTERQEDIYVIDLAHGLGNHNITGTGSNAHEEASLVYSEPSGSIPGGLFYVVGSEPADDPNVGVGVYYFPLDGSTNSAQALGDVISSEEWILFAAYPEWPVGGTP